jgi:nucleotide-binding universal stress UspA family protein
VRVPFVAGNWKMYTNTASARALAAAVVEGLGGDMRVEVAVCPPFTALEQVAAALAEAIDARLVAVHVLDRLVGGAGSAERIAEDIVYDELPDASAEGHDEVGDVAERLAVVAREEQAILIVLGARTRDRSRTYLRAQCAGELAELTKVPVVVAPLQQAALAPQRAGRRANDAHQGARLSAAAYATHTAEQRSA